MDCMTQKPVTILKEYIQLGEAVKPSLVESTNALGEKTKHWYLDGIFIQGEKQNLNGRIYPRSEIENAVNKLQDEIKLHGSVYGECDHPDDLVITLKNVSHIIKEIHMNGNDGAGRMQIIHDVPYGLLVEGLLLNNLPLGVSSRGAGAVDDFTHKVEDYDIITIDIVATPSAPDARPTPVFEKFMNSRGQRLVDNAQDLLMRKEPKSLKEAFNGDFVSYIHNWKF